MRYPRRSRRAIPLLDHLGARCLLAGFLQPPALGYTPAEITGAYGLNAITFRSPTDSPVNGNGAGETIALIEEYHDPHIQSDLKVFDAKFGLPNPLLSVINQAGDRTNNDWALEESMDVEWAHAIAPAAKILVVEAAPANSQMKELQSQLRAENTARHAAGVAVISMSWGFAEFSKELSYDSYFTTPAGHKGITFIASSGDYGFSWYPAASPNVLSVGGTSLLLTGSGGYGSETAWYWSGGGYSQFEGEPGYQGSVQTTGQRSTPNVAFDANPSTGVAIYETSTVTGKGSWQVYGGTSLGTPCWAGIIAIVDQGRDLAGKDSLDGPTQTLPALYSLPASDFHSVTPNNGILGTGGLSSLLGDLFGPGDNGATANIATGLGTPNGPSLITDMVSSTATASPSARTDGGSASPSSRVGLPRKRGARVSHRHHVDHQRQPASQRALRASSMARSPLAE